MWNRVKKVAKGQTGAVLEEWEYSYNNMNQLLQVESRNLTKTFSYDAKGNTLSMTDRGGTTFYSWDFEGRLVKITYPDGSFSTYRYDGEGRRVERVEKGGEVKRFVYDGQNLIAELDENKNPKSIYTYGPVGLLSKRDQSGFFFYHFDGMGSVVAMTDGGQNVVNYYRYDAWGNVIEKEEQVENPFQYVGMLGYYRDEESGLYFLRRRYLNTSLSRFLTVDELNPMGQRHWYVYVCNSPMSRVDPDGRCCGEYSENWVGDPEWLDIPEPPTRQEMFFTLEIWFVFPWWCILYWRCIDRAVERCRQVRVVGDWMAHCLCSCMIAIDCGEPAAICAGYAQEFEGVYDPEDLEANEYGINCARFGFFTDCLKCCEMMRRAVIFY